MIKTGNKKAGDKAPAWKIFTKAAELVPLMAIWRDRLAFPVIAVMPFLMIAIIVAITIIMMIAIVRMPLLVRRIVVATLWRFGIPAVAMPVHTMLIALTVMMPLMIMPPLRRTPVVTIPVIATLILIPEVDGYAGYVNVNRNICLRDHRQCQCTTKQ
jgi:hypothetical protein